MRARFGAPGVLSILIRRRRCSGVSFGMALLRLNRRWQAGQSNGSFSSSTNRSTRSREWLSEAALAHSLAKFSGAGRGNDSADSNGPERNGMGSVAAACLGSSDAYSPSWARQPPALGHLLPWRCTPFYGSFSDPGSFNWHAIATLAVWCMTLFIQRGEHRDTQAIHAKLDELLKGHPNASDRLTRGRINLLGDAPEPAVISQRVRIFVHAPDYLAVLNDDVIELVAIGWRGKAGWS
jgi:hypothetical protein